jgi:hypothetical protein
LLRRLLLATGVVIALLSLARGAFYWSVPTLLGLLAFAGTLAMLHGAAADWSAGRHHIRRWLIAAGSFLALAIALTVIALPRVAHAERLIAAGTLDRAETELKALARDDTARLWANLHLARIRQAVDIAAARDALAQIPRELPQHAIGTAAVDERILRTASADAQREQWVNAAAALALLSDDARGQPRSVAVATAVYVPLAREKVARTDWPGAAEAIVAARDIGVATAQLEPFTKVILAAGLQAVAKAARENDARRRLQARLRAEKILVAWERASGTAGTPPLMTLRTAMAHDLATVERVARRRRTS